MNNSVEGRPIDSSALIHLAVHSPYHSNVFRLEAHLRSVVDPTRLQRAADALAGRYPMLAAGIRQQKSTCQVVPVADGVPVRVDLQPLAYMSAEEIRQQAMRVLYGPHHIAVEFFHALTDGTGGLRFLKALLAEYLGAAPEPVDLRRAWEDSFRAWAGGKCAAIPGGTSWLLPPAAQEARGVSRTTLLFSVEELRAKVQHITLTEFFTALLARAAMKLQQKTVTPDRPLLPVRMMVPVDLRRHFSSGSLRNFSLYALPVLYPDAAAAPFQEVAENMAAQLRAQTSPTSLRGRVAATAALAHKTALLPLWMKFAALRAGFEVCGGRSSCLTVSNLGRVTFPEAVAQELTRLDFLLTPRSHSPYNCGIVSVGDTLSLTITRRGPEAGFETLLEAQLSAQGIHPVRKITMCPADNPLTVP